MIIHLILQSAVHIIIWFSYIKNFKIKLVEKLKLDKRLKEEEAEKLI